MKKLKKFKRFDKGGLTDSSGNPVLSGDGTPIGTGGKGAAAYLDSLENEDYSKQKEQGAKNWKSLKNFFEFGERDEPAPIEERKPPKAQAPDPAKAPAKPAEPAKTEKVESPRVRDSAKDTSETSFDYPTQRGSSNRDDYEGGASPTSGSQTFKANKPAAPKTPKETKYSGEPINVSTGASGFGKSSTSSAAPKAPKAASPDQIPGTDVKTPYEGEKVDNKNLGLKQFAQSTLGATAAGRAVGPAVRGVAALGRMMSSPRAEGKGTGTFPETKPTPKEAPKTEPKTETGGKEAPTYVDHRTAKPVRWRDEADNEVVAKYRAAQEQAKSGNKETPKEAPTRVDPRAAANRRAAESGTKETPKESPTRVDPRAAANRRAAESKGKEAPKATSTADDEVVKEAAKRAAESRRKVTPKRQEDSSKFGGGKGTPSKSKTKVEVKPTAKKFDKPVGEKEGPTVDKVLESKGLAAKKGGKIPAFKKGGLVGRGDGCAMRGRTKGRMV